MWSNTMWGIARWTHVLAAIGVGVVLYTAEEISALDPARLFLFPLLFLTGVWLWVGRARAAHHREAETSVPDGG